jgi:hypothetical protein
VIQTGEPYAYTGDNPVNNRDPKGLDGTDSPFGVGFIPREDYPAGYGEGETLDGSGTAVGSAGTVSPSDRVIGSADTYQQFAQKAGLKYFKVPDEIYNSMTESEQTAANNKFLQRGINQRAIFRVSSNPEDASPGGGYEHEIKYLKAHHYWYSAADRAYLPPIKK